MSAHSYLWRAVYELCRKNVPKDEYARYEKYLLPAWRFMDMSLADQGIENLKFKQFAVVASDSDFEVFGPPYLKDILEKYSNVCADCPGTDRQMGMARSFCIAKVHYQHWFPNAKETYEQMVMNFMRE